MAGDFRKLKTNYLRRTFPLVCTNRRFSQADLAIISYSVLVEPEYADWARMNKGLSLCNLGRYDDASKVIGDYLNYREQEFGPMDTESFKYESSPSMWA